MDKQLIEKIALEVCEGIPLEMKMHLPGYSVRFAERFLSRIDAERRKDAVATFCSRRLEPRGTNEFWGLLRDGVSLEAGDELFLSPTPTIPEGMVLVPIETLKLFPELRDMIAAAQGEK